MAALKKTRLFEKGLFEKNMPLFFLVKFIGSKIFSRFYACLHLQPPLVKG
jgi:hypothetical protein